MVFPLSISASYVWRWEEAEFGEFQEDPEILNGIGKSDKEVINAPNKRLENHHHEQSKSCVSLLTIAW